MNNSMNNILEDFKVYHEDTDFANITKLSITKTGSKWNIFNTDKQRIWIFGEGFVQSELCRSSYKDDSWFMGFDLNDSTIRRLSEWCSLITTEFSNEISGKTIDNTRIPRKIEMKPSLINDKIIYVNVNLDEIACFDSNKNLITTLSPSSDDDMNVSSYSKVYESNSPVAFIIEPSFCWFMNQKFGIHWKLIQIMTKKSNNNNNNNNNTAMDYDDEQQSTTTSSFSIQLDDDEL